MRKLIVVTLLLVAIPALAQAPSLSRVIWVGTPVPAGTTRVRVTTPVGDAEALTPAVNSLNATTVIPMMVAIAPLAKTTPALNTIIAQYVTEIDDVNGNRIWP